MIIKIWAHVSVLCIWGFAQIDSYFNLIFVWPFFKRACIRVCVCVCNLYRCVCTTCTGMCVHIDVYTQVWKPEDNLEHLSVLLSALFPWDRLSHWTWTSLIDYTGYLLRCWDLPASVSGISCTRDYSQLFMWGAGHLISDLYTFQQILTSMETSPRLYLTIPPPPQALYQVNQRPGCLVFSCFRRYTFCRRQRYCVIFSPLYFSLYSLNTMPSKLYQYASENFSFFPPSHKICIHGVLHQIWDAIILTSLKLPYVLQPEI